MAALAAGGSFFSLKLEVELRVHVGFFFGVDLQPSPIAVGDDDAVLLVHGDAGGLVEPTEVGEVLHSLVRLDYVGIGVDRLLGPLGEMLRIAPGRAERLVIRGKNPDTLLPQSAM